MKIIIDDLTDPQIAEFLDDHIKEMKSVSPPESKHTLDLEGLRKPEITFWSVWEDDILVGCGALCELDTNHCEIKSMRTSPRFKRKGIASRLLQHILNECKKRGYQKVSLETGSMEYFIPAINLYKKFGFSICRPFSNYIEDPNSVFMTKEL